GPGMTGTQVESMAGHMAAALQALEVQPEIAEKILAILRAHASETLERGAGGEATPDVADPAPAEQPKDAGKKAKKAAAAGPAAAKTDDGDEAAKDSAVANQSIRVNVELLENLMTMVSELVLTRNQVLQILRTQKDSEFAAPLQRLNHITSELQEGVMK